MTNQEITNYLLKQTKPLVESLSHELPAENNPVAIQKLKELVSYAESQRATLATLLRRLNELVESRKLELLQQFDEDYADKKTTRDVRSIYVKAKLASEIANVNYIENLQDAVKSRISLGQSFLKSKSIEDESGYNSNELRLS